MELDQTGQVVLGYVQLKVLPMLFPVSPEVMGGREVQVTALPQTDQANLDWVENDACLHVSHKATAIGYCMLNNIGVSPFPRFILHTSPAIFLLP